MIIWNNKVRTKEKLCLHLFCRVSFLKAHKPLLCCLQILTYLFEDGSYLEKVDLYYLYNIAKDVLSASAFLPRAEITGVCCHARFIQCWEPNLVLCVLEKLSQLSRIPSLFIVICLFLSRSSSKSLV